MIVLDKQRNLKQINLGNQTNIALKMIYLDNQENLKYLKAGI